MNCPTCAKWRVRRPLNDYDLREWESGGYRFKQYTFYCGHYRTIREAIE